MVLTRTALLLIVSLLITQSSCSIISRLTGQDITSNRTKWKASGITDYKMKVVIQKPGHMTPMGTYLITIRGGKTESVYSGPSPQRGTIPPDPVDHLTDEMFLQRLAPYDSIDDYFSQMERVSKENPELFETTFDPVLGYPTFLHFDPKRTTMDDELLVRVLSLERL